MQERVDPPASLLCSSSSSSFPPPILACCPPWRPQADAEHRSLLDRLLHQLVCIPPPFGVQPPSSWTWFWHGWWPDPSARRNHSSSATSSLRFLVQDVKQYRSLLVKSTIFKVFTTVRSSVRGLLAYIPAWVGQNFQVRNVVPRSFFLVVGSVMRIARTRVGVRK